MSNARIVCLTRAVTKITHMAESAGNESIIAREPVTTSSGERRNVPTLSGNALRHVCVRAPGMHWLMEELDLAGKLTLAQLNFIFHGGSLTESTSREPTMRIIEMQRSWPLLKLLGGALPDQVLTGSLRAGPGVLVCEENRSRLESIIGANCLDDLPPLAPSESCVESYQYVTYDVKNHEATLAEQASDYATSKSDPRMLYAGQCVRAGSCFAHEFFLLDPTTIDVGCLLWSLNLWQRGGGVVGGMGAKGHGRTDTLVRIDGDYDAAACVADYLRHAREQKGTAIAWLNGVFARPEKPKKAAMGRKKKADTEPAEAANDAG